MARAAAISPFIADDPVQAGPGVASLAGLLESLGLQSLVRPGAIPIVPGVALVHALTGATGPLALRFVRLPRAVGLGPGLEAVESAVVLTAPLAEAGLFRNRGVWLGIAAEIGILLILILTPPLRAVFGLSTLRVAEWGPLLAYPPVMILLDEGRKWLTRMRRRRRP